MGLYGFLSFLGILAIKAGEGVGAKFRLSRSSHPTELGLKTEIVPLSKPFGLWEHNVFQGVVKMDGAPVPYAEVEVEFLNDRAGATAPDELMITQTVKADADGVSCLHDRCGSVWSG